MEITACSKSTELRDQSWDEECANGWSSSLKTKPLILYLKSLSVVKSLAGLLGAAGKSLEL